MCRPHCIEVPRRTLRTTSAPFASALLFYHGLLQIPGQILSMPTARSWAFPRKISRACVFEPLNLRSIHICLHIVPKAPAKTHVGVVIFETEEILPTDPSTFIPVFPIDGITEDLGIFRNIVCNETSEFTRQYGSVSYRTSSGEQIHERMRRGKIRNNPFRNTILRTLIR